MFANELSNIAIATLCTSGIFISGKKISIIFFLNLIIFFKIGSIIKGIADYILKHKE